MSSKNQNTVGNITGDNNKVIQIILQDGKEVAEKLGVLIDRLLNKEKEQIETLKKRIADKEETIHDKTKIVDYQDAEIIRLKTTLSEKQQQLEASEARFTQTFLENDGKDFTGSKELYPKALQLLTEGKKKEAIAVLNRHELLERKKKRDKENEQEVASWLLRADLLKEENIWGEELNECYDVAAEIFSSWHNNLLAANHYHFKNNFIKARQHYQVCLVKAASDGERATTLNNLGNLQRDQNEYVKAAKSYGEALEIYRKLAAANPKTYLPYVATTLNNLAVLQRDQNEYVKAAKSYDEALEIRRKLAAANPQTYLPDVGMILNNLGNLQRAQNEYVKAAKSYGEALEIYRKLVAANPQTYSPYVATTLNNLGILQRAQNDHEKAEQSYEEALEIYRKLAAVNPQTYSPYVADTLNNLGILQSDQNDYEKAEQSYQEALKIRMRFAKLIPKTYEIPLADTYLCLSSLYRYHLSDKSKSMSFAIKAVELYRKYWDFVPSAKKWRAIAKKNLDY